MKTKQKLTPKQENYRKRLLAQVHLAPKYVEHYVRYNDDYRAMLNQYFGVETSANLSIDELKVLVSFLNGTIPEPVVRATRAQLCFIWHLWQQKARVPTEKALKQFICAMYGWTPISLDVLSRGHANGVLGALRKLPNSRLGEK